MKDVGVGAVIFIVLIVVYAVVIASVVREWAEIRTLSMVILVWL